MNLLQITVILGSVNIGIIVGIIYASKKGSIEFYNQIRQSDKEKRKQRILLYIKKHGSIKNKEVEELLDVSPKTATNYLQELKKEERLSQHGKRGRSVHYTIK